MLIKGSILISVALFTRALSTLKTTQAHTDNFAIILKSRTFMTYTHTLTFVPFIVVSATVNGVLYALIATNSAGRVHIQWSRGGVRVVIDTRR